MSGAPLMGAIAVPLVGEVVDSQGWRAGYQLLAVMSAAGGLVAVLCIGRGRKNNLSHSDAAIVTASQKKNPVTFFELLRQPVFLMLVGGMFLVNTPPVIVSSQLKLVLYESGAQSHHFAVQEL